MIVAPETDKDIARHIDKLFVTLQETLHNNERQVTDMTEYSAQQRILWGTGAQSRVATFLHVGKLYRPA